MAVALQKNQEMAAHWKTQIEQCDKEYKTWVKRSEKINKNYRDDRDERDNNRRLNLFWANVQTYKPAIYSKTPVPICERRFLDKDTTGRVASTILERCLRYEVQMSGFSGAVKRVRNDYLTVGRGQVWVRYNPVFGEPISPKQQGNDEIEQDGKELDKKQTEATEQVERQVLSESLDVAYLHWKDFYIFPAYVRTWDEVEGVGRKLYMSRADLIKKFGEEKGKKIELDYTPKGLGYESSPSTLTGVEGMQATVYEIWWKPDRKVYFIAKGYDQVCQEADDPLKLEGFFPCPEPLYATLTNDSLIPVPDYVESQDQYSQIDDLTKRIDILTSACRVVGVYDSSAQALKRVFQEAQEPNLIPVESWAMFAEKGGLKGAIDWVPIEQVANTLKILIEVRQQIMADLDRMTGISDIMRGTSDARETMGAQRLKTNNTSTRLVERQDDMSRFCRDIIAIMGEIISEHYDPKTLVQVSGALYDEGLDPPDLPPVAAPMMGHNGGPPLDPMQAAPPAMQGAAPPVPGSIPGGAPQPAQQPPQETPEQKQQRKMEMIAAAIELLRSDKNRGFRIDIETDSTVQGDAETEKAQRVAFVEGVTKFIETAGPMVMQVPEFAPVAAKMLMFAVRGFRVGRDLESTLEEFGEKMEQMAKQSASNPKPDPEMIKAQTERMKAESEIKRQEIENAGELQNGQIDLQSKQMDMRMKEIELEIKKLDFHSNRIKAAASVATANAEGGEEGTDSDGIHPHMALNQIAEAAKVFDLASRRNAAPKEIVRDETGRAKHIITHFKE